jgi:hypothetical protein
MSAVAAHAAARFRVLGDRGAFTKLGLDVQEDALRAGARPADRGWGEDESGNWGELASDRGVERISTQRGTYEQFYAQTAAMLRDGAPPPVAPSDAVAVLEIVDRARAGRG